LRGYLHATGVLHWAFASVRPKTLRYPAHLLPNVPSGLSRHRVSLAVDITANDTR